MELPASHDTPEFRAKWKEWNDYRKLRKLPKYKTSRVIMMLLRFPPKVGIEAINHSLDLEYAGLFPGKFGHEQPSRAERRVSGGGRAQSPPGKYDSLDKGTPPPPSEEDPGDKSAA